MGRSGAARKRRLKMWAGKSVVERNAESMDDGVSFDLFTLGFLMDFTISPLH